MMRLRSLSRALVLLGVAVAAAGCSTTVTTLAFGTATKFALDISQRPDQLVEVVLGYDRVEIVSIPATDSDATRNADGSGTDTYAVLGTFSVSYGTPWAEPLKIRQFFATGRAAREAAENPEFQRLFGRTAGEIQHEADKQIRAQREKAKGAQ
jgi:hypothetical protein